MKVLGTGSWRVTDGDSRRAACGGKDVAACKWRRRRGHSYRLPSLDLPAPLEFFMAPPLLGGEHEWTSGGLERFSFSVVVLGKLFYGSNIELGRRGHICIAYGSDDRAVSSSVAGRRKNNACSLLDESNPHPTHPQSVSVALSIKTIPFF